LKTTRQTCHLVEKAPFPAPVFTLSMREIE
jgi:hypothetical protein